MAAVAVQTQQYHRLGEDDAAMAPDQHRQGEGNAMMKSPLRGQEEARRGRPSMINAGGARGVHRRRSAKIKQTKTN
jgi:hypothetical protein